MSKDKMINKVSNCIIDKMGTHDWLQLLTNIQIS
jgi:hypothetical protein